jgi:hypothetical protein
MAMYPGRFPNEIVEGLDVAMHNQILAAQKVMRVEEARLAFLRASTDPGETWLDIREHDKLVEDYTVKVIE